MSLNKRSRKRKRTEGEIKLSQKVAEIKLSQTPKAFLASKPSSYKKNPFSYENNKKN
jgi:hypothetical protein